MGGLTFGGGYFGQYAPLGNLIVVIIPGDEITTAIAVFARVVTAQDVSFAREVTTADAER